MDETRHRKSMIKCEQQLEDRLSSLPDAILIDILSRLYTDNAAATSVLSRRWRHLWTGVTRLAIGDFLDYDSDNCLRLIVFILQHLTSPKLSVFDIRVLHLDCPSNDANSCFRLLRLKNVEHVFITAEGCDFPDDGFLVPVSLFQTLSLVVLRLSFWIRLPDRANIQILPNLKILELKTLVNLPSWLGTLLSSSPLLENLELKFDLFIDNYKPRSDLHISAPNLKYLNINISSPVQTPPAKVSIDAPSLISFTIIDSTSCYYFVQKPLGLNSAFIVSGKDRMFDDLHLEWMEDNRDQDYLYRMSKFVAGLSSVCELELELTLLQPSQNSIYTYLNSLNLGPLTITFPNLVSLETILDDVGLNSWKDLLLSLHCFPNLSYLYVNMESDLPVEHYNWHAPDSVPDCLVHKLKKIEITMNLDMIEDELKLLSYILSNAVALEKLCISASNEAERGKDELWNASKFCKSLFELPRGSSSCEILFSNVHIKASSNDFKKGSLKCELFL